MYLSTVPMATRSADYIPLRVLFLECLKHAEAVQPSGILYLSRPQYLARILPFIHRPNTQKYYKHEPQEAHHHEVWSPLNVDNTCSLSMY